MRGLLIAFEGLDQSGKQTQAEWLRDRLSEAGRRVRLLSFPAYETPIGVEIRQGLAGARDWGAGNRGRIGRDWRAAIVV